MVRAIGPSLANSGVTNPLADPNLTLYDQNGVVMAFNDDWMNSSQAAHITSVGFAPTDNKESAILFVPAPGAYTAIIRGAGASEGVGLVEVYRLSPQP